MWFCPSYYFGGAFPLPLDVGYHFLVGMQHSPVDGCSVVGCSFEVLIGEDECTSFYSTILCPKQGIGHMEWACSSHFPEFNSRLLRQGVQAWICGPPWTLESSILCVSGIHIPITVHACTHSLKIYYTGLIKVGVFPGGSDGKESICNTGYLDLIPG